MVDKTKHLVIPYSLANNDGKFNSGAFGSPLHFENHLKANFDWLYKEGETHPKMMNIGLHMRLVGHAGRAQALSNFIEYAKVLSGCLVRPAHRHRQSLDRQPPGHAVAAEGLPAARSDAR